MEAAGKSPEDLEADVELLTKRLTWMRDWQRRDALRAAQHKVAPEVPALVKELDDRINQLRAEYGEKIDSSLSVRSPQWH